MNMFISKFLMHGDKLNKLGRDALTWLGEGTMVVKLLIKHMLEKISVFLIQNCRLENEVLTQNMIYKKPWVNCVLPKTLFRNKFMKMDDCVVRFF